MAGDDFLSRWSRRKREVVQAEVPEELTIPAPPPEADALPLQEDDDPLDENALSDEAIAALPSLDSLTVETDLTQFLKAGVPQVLRNAALRRMWSIDPSIRDYLCEAREYAFDWHIPGAVPGTGPMLPTDDIAGMVRDIFAGSKPHVVEPPFDGAASEEVRGDPPSPEQAGMAEERRAPDVESPTRPAPDMAAISAPVEADGDHGDASLTETTPVESTRETAPGARLRRHGGAFPI